MKIVLHVLRILLGIVFIISAVSKFLSMDEFEIYVFSHHILSFNLSAVAARLLIGFEFFIGIMLIINFYFKQVWMVSVFMLSGFTIYLAVLAISGSSENCHCFGEMLDLNPIQSMLKNGILLLGFVSIRSINPYRFKYRLLITILIGAITLSLPMIFSPPDFFFPQLYSKMSTVKDGSSFDSLVINNETFPIKCDSGKKILSFYSTGCRFCKLSERKISSIVQRNNLDSTKFANIFWGDSTKLAKFYKENSIQFEHAFLPTADFMSITGGRMPQIILLQDGKITHRYGYRDLDEAELVKFIQK